MPPEPATSLRDWPILTSAIVCILIVSRVVKLFTTNKLLKGIPRSWVAFSPIKPPGAAIPTCWWNPGIGWPWEWRLSFYQKWASEVVSFVPFLFGPPIIYTSSPEVARQIVGGGYQSVWAKPKLAAKAFDEWGPSLLTSNKEDWRRHRRIVGPAFNAATYSTVWAETSRVYRDIITTEGWTQQDLVTLRSVQAYTIRVAFLVISTCGFGLPFQWEEPTENDDGEMGVQKAMRIWVDTVLVRMVAPPWVYKLPFKRLRDITMSIQVLRDYMTKVISERRAELNGETTARDTERKDIFSLLVRAGEEDSKFMLSDSELVGNVFGMLFAGHETTASTLAVTIGFLGLYSEVQEDVYQQIMEVIGRGRDPTFEDFPRLEKVAHAFYEALRLYPPAFITLREATEDTILSIPNADGQPGMRQVPIPKDLLVAVDLTGIQYNPRYFPNPNRYDPSRWRGITAESEDISVFSIGPRTCIGRKFAVVEAVCFLTLLVRDWIIEPIMNPGETSEQWRERVMQIDIKMTLSVKALPVQLRRRARTAPSA